MAASSLSTSDETPLDSFSMPTGSFTVGGDQGASSMDTSIDYTSKSRESVQHELEKKLRCRADRDHLVQMNILPAVSTAPVILAQTHKLQRQKTADSLQQKLRERATRTELYRRNILPDSKLSVDPSLSATQKQLQKRRMADDLNVKISNRPGVLELVEGHILEPHLGKALESYLQNSDTSSSDSNPIPTDPRSTLVTPSPTSSIGFSLQVNDTSYLERQKFSDSSSPVLSPGDSILLDDQKSPAMLFSPQGDIPTPPPPPSIDGSSKSLKSSTSHSCKAPSPSQARKRHNKPRYRKLRYHEYIPPSKNGSKGGKTNSVSKSTPTPNNDSPYSLLLQQQQLFLQLQVLQQQYPNGVLVQKLPDLMKNLPASLTEKAQALLKPKTAGMETSRPVVTKTHEIPEDIKVRTHGGTVTVRLDELKVHALKAACKEQNLMVSGKKVELIERLLDHNNGVLPTVVLSDTSGKERRQSHMSHGVGSIESTNSSPQSPEPDSLFQFPGRTPSTSQAMETGSPMVGGLVGQLQNCDIQQQVDKMIEKKKIDYLSANGPKTVAPRPDLSKLVAINHPQTNDKKSNFKHSKSLPTTPQQLSPAGSTENILHEFMEQSPKPSLPLPPAVIQQQQQQLAQVQNESSDSLMYHNPRLSQTSINQFGQQRRSGRTSLPNPPPYPGIGVQNPNFVSSDLTGSSHFSGGFNHHQNHLAVQRSVSLSGPSSSVANNRRQQPLTSALVAETTGLNSSNEPLAAFTNDDNICLNELMEMDTDFHDLFKILEKEEQGGAPSSALVQSHQSISFDQLAGGGNSRIGLPHQDSTQSDSVMFGVPMTHDLKSNNSMDMLPPSLDNDPKGTSGGGNTNTGTNINDLGTLNLDSALLGSSPHLQGYFPSEPHNLGHQSPFDYFQNGLADPDMSYKPSSNDMNTGLDSHQQLLEAAQFSTMNGGGGLFGTTDTSFLDMNLAS